MVSLRWTSMQLSLINLDAEVTPKEAYCQYIDLGVVLSIGLVLIIRIGLVYSICQ